MELGSRNLNKTMKVSYTFTDIHIPSQIFVYSGAISRGARGALAPLIIYDLLNRYPIFLKISIFVISSGPPNV